MGDPMDWLARSRAIGTYEPPVFNDQGGDTDPGYPDDNVWMDAERAERARIRAAEMQRQREEAEDEAEDRRAQRELRRLERNARMEKLVNPHQNESQLAQAMKEMVQSQAEAMRDIREELREARSAAEKSSNDALVAQIKALGDQLSHMRTATPSDPIEEAIASARKITALSEAMNSVLPKPSPADQKPTRREIMEEIRITEEAEIRKMEAQARIGAVQAQRELAQAELAVKERRVTRAAGLAEDLLGPVVAKILGDKAGEVAGGLAQPDVANGGEHNHAEPPGAADLPVVECPNPECRKQLRVNPAEGPAAKCQFCDAVFTLVPNA